MKKIGLLPRIVIAIVMGILIGNVLPEGWVRVFVTFNYVFSQFLGFLIPLIIIGLVTPAIADIGKAMCSHAQMDGSHAARFLEELQKTINTI